MDYGRVWRPGECIPDILHTASLKVVGDFLPPQRCNTPAARYNTPDPDYENAENILERLEDTTAHTPLINLNCECLLKHNLTKKQQDLYSSKHFSDSDSDDEGTSYGMLMKMLTVLPSRLPSKTASKAFQTVLDGYTCKETLTLDQMEDILPFLKHSNTVIRELTLTFLSKLGAIPGNAEIMLDKDIIQDLHVIITTPHTTSLTVALQLIQVLVTHEGLKDKWIEPISTHIYPDLMSLLKRDGATLECKYSICCVFRELTQYTEYLEVTQNHIIPAVSAIKDNSGKLREVYTEILTGLLTHTDVLPPDIIDSGIVPSTVSMIREGPCGTQVQALKLLSGLSDKESGIPAVIDNVYAVPYIICCIKESKCRKVKREALRTLSNLTRTRRLGVCKDFMVHAASYLIPTESGHSHLMGRPSSAGNRVTTPNRGSHHVEKDSVLWKGVHRLIKIVGIILNKECLAETNKADKVTTVGYKPCIDMCSIRVVSLSRCAQLLQNICMWPTGKNKQDISKLDLKNFTENDVQRLKLSKLNRSLAQRVWDNVGNTIVQLLGAFSNKIASVHTIAQQHKEGKGNPCSQHANEAVSMATSPSHEAINKMVDKRGLVDLMCIFEQEELDLIKSLLELILCIALCSCKDFPDLMAKKQKSPNHISNQGRATRSDSSLGKPPLPRKLMRPSSAQQRRSTSPVKEIKQTWVKENPHLTHTLDRHSSLNDDFHGDHSKTDISHFHAELMKKEAATERRIIRKCLYEADTLHVIGAFLKSSQDDLQTLSCQILRCCVQPLEEKVYPQAAPTPTKQRIVRPQSASGAKEMDHKMKVAFHYMSPEIANLIREALGPDFDAVAHAQEVVKVETTPIDDAGAVDRLTSYMKSKNTIKIEPKPSHKKPVIDICRPIASQCRECLLREVATCIISSIFSKSKDVRKSAVMLLQDLVHFGDVENHMTLSKHGCMQRLLDFIRMNTDDELLEIIGLIIVQMLVSSDERIKQVFNRYGGTRLLTNMARLTTGLLREEVTRTLHTVSTTKPGHTKRPVRPMSAPLSRSRSHAPADVWDDIQDRWKTEDKVSAILGSWK